MAARKKEPSIDKIIKFNLKNNKDLVWIIAGMIGLIVLFLAFYFIFQSSNKFKFEGLTFTKERYSGNIFVYHYYYSFDDNNAVNYFNLYLRLDPRKQKVIVDKNALIGYEKLKHIYINVNSSGLGKCEDSSMALGSLSSFFAGNHLTAWGTTQDQAEANRTNIRFNITCENTPERVVINVHEGNETRIDIAKKGRLCYDISVANCQILAAIERFMIESLVDAKNVSSQNLLDTTVYRATS